MTLGRERAVMLVAWAAAAAACLLGAFDPPSAYSHPSFGQQAYDLVRIATTTALAIVVLLAPGIGLRALTNKRIGLAFLPLPGLALLIATGGVAWALAGEAEAQQVCFAVFAPLLALILVGLLNAGPEDMLEAEEQHVLLLTGLALGVAIGRSLWSLGPAGELYSGGISRTLIPEPRPDSRIPYVLPQLIAHGTDPYSPVGSSYFTPYNFSSRGPLAGMATSPVVLMAGGKPPLSLPEMRWQPFDPQGFMAFRLTMMTLTCTAFLSVWELARRIGGSNAARLAALLVVATPFFIHELWFTWPKLLAGSFVVLGGICIVERRPLRSGLLIGIGYLMHPGALIGICAAGLLALWPLRRPNWRRPDLRAAALLIAGTAVSLIFWRLVNGSHYSQEGFLDYLTAVSYYADPTLADWIGFRLSSLANTLVPMVLPVFYADDPSINALGGGSPAAIHFFYQYWTGLPFGFGILFFPLLLISLWRAARLWPWPVFAVVLVPLLTFTVYWGASDSGMLREGLQAWALVLIAVVALQQAHAGLPWLRSLVVRAILALRALAMLAVALGPTLFTNDGRLLDGTFAITDIAALLAMVGFSLGLAVAIWRATDPSRGWQPVPA